MTSIRNIAACSGLMLFAGLWQAGAQQNGSGQEADKGGGLNATVQISNDYKVEIPPFEKISSDLPTPDSLYRFDLNFDYGGFENPYKGTNYFNPFLTDLDLAPRESDYRKFYMKAGAGYTLAPTFDLEWTFKSKGRFRASAFASHRSYWGDYNYIEADGNGSLLPDGQKWNGFEARTKAGFSGRVDLLPLSIRMMLWYDGVQSSNKQPLVLRTGDNFNQICGRFALSSNPGNSRWRYALDVAYSYAFNSYSYDYSQDGSEPVSCSFDDTREDNVKASGLLGYRFGESSLEVGFNIDYTRGKDNDVYGIVPDGYDAYWACVTPKYVLSRKRVYFSLGLAFAFCGGNNIRNKSGFTLYPDLDFSWSIVPSYLDLYSVASIKGALYGFSSTLKDITYPVFPDQFPAQQFPISRFSNFVLGLRGNAGGVFHYDLSAGIENDVDKVYYMPQNSELGDFYFIDADCESHGTFYGQFKTRVEAGGFLFRGDVRYNLFFKEAGLSNIPSHLTFDVMAKYTILGRIGLSVGAEYRSRASMFSKGISYYVPAFTDLYAGIDYGFNSNVRLFVDGRNLLNDCLQYIPGFARSSICITGGVVLKF